MINPLLSHATYMKELTLFIDSIGDQQPMELLSFYNLPRPPKSELAYEAEKYVLQEIQKWLESQWTLDGFSFELISYQRQHQLMLFQSDKPYAFLDGAHRAWIPLTTSKEYNLMHQSNISGIQQQMSFLKTAIRQTEQKLTTRKNKLKKALFLPVQEEKDLETLQKNYGEHDQRLTELTQGVSPWESEQKQLKSVTGFFEFHGFSVVDYDGSLHFFQPHQSERNRQFFDAYSIGSVEGLLSSFRVFDTKGKPVMIADAHAYDPVLQTQGERVRGISVECIHRLQRNKDCQPLFVETWEPRKNQHLFLDGKRLEADVDIRKVIFRFHDGLYTLCDDGKWLCSAADQQLSLAKSKEEHEVVHSFIDDIIKDFT